MSKKLTSLSSLFQIIIAILKKKLNLKKKEGGSLVLGGSSMA